VFPLAGRCWLCFGEGAKQKAAKGFPALCLTATFWLPRLDCECDWELADILAVCGPTKEPLSLSANANLIQQLNCESAIALVLMNGCHLGIELLTAQHPHPTVGAFEIRDLYQVFRGEMWRTGAKQSSRLSVFAGPGGPPISGPCSVPEAMTWDP
jgi:hypothetical protein